MCRYMPFIKTDIPMLTLANSSDYSHRTIHTLTFFACEIPQPCYRSHENPCQDYMCHTIKPKVSVMDSHDSVKLYWSICCRLNC